VARLVVPARGIAVIVAVAAIMASGMGTARRLGVFQVAAVQSRAPAAGALLRERLPLNAVLLASEQSGSMRHETGRPIVRWDELSAAELRQVLAALHARHLEPWWVLDQWEESIVRSRFRDVPEAALDWPPRIDAGALMRTRAWRIADAQDN
jgi:hypothetical protein